MISAETHLATLGLKRRNGISGNIKKQATEVACFLFVFDSIFIK